MTTNTDLGLAQYTANGATTAFVFAAGVLDPTHLLVQTLDLSTPGAVPITKALTMDYNVTGTGQSSTSATVTFLVAPLNNTRVSISRNVPNTQTATYTPNDPFPAKTHEAALDKLTQITQQLANLLKRSLSFPTSAAASLVATLPLAPVADATLAWDGVTGAIKNGATITDLANAQANAATATAAAAVAVAAVSGATDLWGGTSSGTANALVFTPSPAIAANAAGILIRGLANADNTAAATVATSGKPAIQIVKFNGAAFVDIEKGDIRSGMTTILQYISTTQAHLLNPRGPNRVVNTVSNASAVTINTDTTTTWSATAQAANLTFNAPSGTPVDGQDLLIRVTDDGLGTRTLTFTGGAGGFRFSTNLPAPSATTLGKMIELGFKYNLAAQRWDNLAQLNGF